jgi:hypothetical protein
MKLLSLGRSRTEQVVTCLTLSRISLGSTRRCAKWVRSSGSRSASSRTNRLVGWLSWLGIGGRVSSSSWWRLVGHNALPWSSIEVRIKFISVFDLRWLLLLVVFDFNIVSLQFIGEISIHAVHTSGSNIRISLDNSQRILESGDSAREHSSALSHLWGLSKHIRYSLVRVDSVPEVLGQLVLGFLNKEVANLLGNSIANTAEDKGEIRVNSSSDFFNERVLSTHLGLGSIESLLLGLIIGMTRVERYFSRVVSLVFFKVHVISENIALFSFDDGTNHLEGVGSALG